MRRESILLLSTVLAIGSARASAETQPRSATTGCAATRNAADFFAARQPKTAREMVDLLPGFTFSAGDNSRRGFAAAAGNVLIDGERPSDKQFTLGDLLSRIPADQVDHVEVIRDSCPGLDMLGQTVVVNVVRKRQTGRALTVTASDAWLRDGRNLPSATVEISKHFSGGQTLTGAVSLTRYAELAEGDGASVRRDAARNVLQQSSVTSRAGGLTGFGFVNYATKLIGGQFSVNGSLVRTDFTFRETDRSAAGASTHLDQNLGGPLGGQLRGELGANFSRSLGGKWTMQAQALVDLHAQSYTSRLTDGNSDQAFQARERGGEALARANLIYATSSRLSAQLALEGTFNWLHTTNGFSYNGFAIQLPNARANVTEARGQASAQLSWTATSWLKTEFALNLEHSSIASRADVRQSKALTYAKPRLALIVSPNADNQLRLRVEREVGQLDFNNFVASSSLDIGGVHAGNVDIVPQQAWVFEAAYERHFWSSGDVSLTLRHSAISHAIDRILITSASGPAFDAPGNISSATLDALIVSATLPLARLGIAHGELKVSGTFQRSRVQDPVSGAMRSLTNVLPAEYTISFRQDVPRWKMSWGASLATPCATSATTKGCEKYEYRFNEIDYYGAQPALNLFVEYRPAASLTLRLEANNILAQQYRRLVKFYGGPRNTSPLSYEEDRRLNSSPSVFLSVRKGF